MVGTCCWRTGMASAQDAQCAACACSVAEVRPRPPNLTGRCAMASAVAGSGPVSSKVVKQCATAVSWSWAYWVVARGGSIRSR